MVLFLQKLNCRIRVVNPNPLFIWGTVHNGEATGLCKLMADDDADFSIGDITGYYERQKVSVYSYHLNFGEAISMATPMAVPRR